MNDREKRWFIYLEIEGRKAKSSGSKVSPESVKTAPGPMRINVTPNKTSTPIRKTFKPSTGLSFKKRFSSGGSSSRKV